MDGRILGFVWMAFTRIDFEFAELCATKACLWDHAPDRALDEEDWFALTDFTRSFDFLTTDVSGETGVDLVGLFRAGENYVLGIGDDDEIASVNVGCEGRLVFATEQTCGFHGDLAENFAFGIDHIPFAFDFMWLGGKCLHFSNREVLRRGAIERAHPEGRGT